jgi:hypothetical protein
MALETGSFISDLNSSNPQSTDSVSQADDHIRLIKSTVKATFPNVTGAVTKTHTQLNNTLDKTGDTMTGALTLSGAPSSNLHAATKAYVDTADAGKAATTTTVSAGTGLTGGGDLSANRTLSIADSGVTTAKIADSSVTTAKIANSAVTSAKLASGAAVANIGYTPVNPSEFTGANQSKATSGFQKLPGGLVLQWGEISSTIDSAQTFSFTTTFSSACVFVSLVRTDNSGGNVQVNASSYTTTGFTLVRNSNLDGTYTFKYFAIGY